MKTRKNQSPSIFRSAALRTYLPQGLDAVLLQEIKQPLKVAPLVQSGEHTEDFARKETLMKRKLKSEMNRAEEASVLWTSFLGFSNRRRGLEKTISWSSLFKNFIGWQDGVSIPKKVLNGILAIPVFLPYNLIRWVFKLSVNLAKGISEFLPKLGDEFSLRKLEELQASGKLKPDKKGEMALAQAGSFIFTAVLFLLRSLTSPIDNIRLTWLRIQHIANSNAKSEIPFINALLKGNPKVATFLGIVLCGLSAAITVTAVVLLFKFALPLALVKIAPVIGPKILAAVSHLLAKAGIYLGAKLGITISAPAFSMGATAFLSACALPIARGLEYLKNVAQRAYSFLGKLTDSSLDKRAQNPVDVPGLKNSVKSGNILGSSGGVVSALKSSEEKGLKKSGSRGKNPSDEDTKSFSDDSSSDSPKPPRRNQNTEIEVQGGSAPPRKEEQSIFEFIQAFFSAKKSDKPLPPIPVEAVTNSADSEPIKKRPENRYCTIL